MSTRRRSAPDDSTASPVPPAGPVVDEPTEDVTDAADHAGPVTDGPETGRVDPEVVITSQVSAEPAPPAPPAPPAEPVSSAPPPGPAAAPAAEPAPAPELTQAAIDVELAAIDEKISTALAWRDEPLREIDAITEELRRMQTDAGVETDRLRIEHKKNRWPKVQNDVLPPLHARKAELLKLKNG